MRKPSSWIGLLGAVLLCAILFAGEDSVLLAEEGKSIYGGQSCKPLCGGTAGCATCTPGLCVLVLGFCVAITGNNGCTGTSRNTCINVSGPGCTENGASSCGIVVDSCLHVFPGTCAVCGNTGAACAAGC